MRTAADNWRPARGYEGRYEISIMGEIRSLYSRRWGRLKKPHMLKPWLKPKTPDPQHRHQNAVVRLTSFDGVVTELAVSRLMRDAWMGGPREGYVVRHINGNLLDNSLNNLEYITRQELGIATGGYTMDPRRAVKKIDPKTLQVIEFYSSARKAAKQNHMSYQTIIDRCNNPTAFKSRTAPDGYIYSWES